MLNSLKKNAFILSLFAIVCTALVAVTDALTEGTIKEQQQRELIKTINVLVPHDTYNNDLFASCFLETAPQFLGSKDPQKIYLAKKDDKPVAIAIEAFAPSGYNGAIKFVVGIWQDGRVAGVRVLGHNETPGLGDKIEIAKSEWITSFNNRILQSENDPSWAVTKDGGEFDSFTGATITPRAVVEGVKNVLLYYQREQTKLLHSQPNCEAS